MTKIFSAIVAVFMLAGFTAGPDPITPKNNLAMNSIFELAINQAKSGQLETFQNTRAKFLEVLGKEEAALNEGKWAPFFTLNPELNLEEVLIGMTEWKSFEGFGDAAQRLMPQEVTQQYFASFNPLAYALLEPVDGKSFDMNSIKKAGQVVEFAIRKGKTADAFGEKREVFFKSLEKYDGYRFAREFRVYKLNEQGVPNLADNTQAVMIVWESPEKFQAAATPIFSTKEYLDFAAKIDVEAYFASFPIQ